MLGDGLVELVEAGVITNARKKIDTGVSINGALIGTRKLYQWAHRNKAMRMCATTYTHDDAVLAQPDQLVTSNYAIEGGPNEIGRAPRRKRVSKCEELEVDEAPIKKK